MWPDSAPMPVEVVPTADDAQVVAVLSEAFADYPALRYLIGPAGAAYPERLAALLGFFVAARRARGEPVLGVRSGGAWAAGVLATLPEAVTPPGALDAARARTCEILGADARARYEDLGDLGRASRSQSPTCT